MDSLLVFYQSLLAITTIIVLGFLLGKLKMITADSAKVMANLLLSVMMPCALFMAFGEKFSPESWQMFLKAVIGGLLMMGSAIIASRLIFRQKDLGKNYFQHQFAFIFNNASFLGYPLTLAIFGKEAMLIYSGLMLVFNLALFSYGVWLFEKKITPLHLLEMILNPNIIAVLLGLLFFLLSFSLPDFLKQTVNYLASVTTPLSLLIVGFMLSEIKNWWSILRKWRLLLTVLLQLLLMPTITFLVLFLTMMPKTIVQLFTLIQALPTATSLALFTEKYGGSGEEASQLVLLSTLVSAFTLPVVMTAVLSLI